ncbi:hypothetical protein LIER_14519 [Lithospermum erythrorhizon]|uniref:HIT-type domain-containing protein n=1 Tax=Lithospermum erythrorhizon TaxID=34254 RepID=A0AAV3Q124_LITER
MDNVIMTTETPSNTASSRIICRVCQKQFSQYTCPRCNTRYCSLNCYKSHSIRCTESFMKDNVMGEFHHLKSNHQTNLKMIHILKRLHSQDEDSDNINDRQEPEDSSLSEETIYKILSGHHVTLEDLSPDEAKRFKTAVASGELSKLIKPWEPWWMKPLANFISLGQHGTPLVQPLPNQNQVSENDDLQSDRLDNIPRGPEAPLPSIKKLSSSEPSPLLAIHLVDIVYAYCFTLRLYNGDWESDPVGSAMAMFSISCVLGEGGLPETVSQALSHCLEQTCSPAFRHMGGFQFAMGLVDDVLKILDLGCGALVCLLSDLRRLIQASRRDQNLEEEDTLRRKEFKNKLKAAERKVYFITCWVNEQPEEAWSSLATIVNAEKASAMECQGKKPESSHVKDKVENKGKPLIKEIG